MDHVYCGGFFWRGVYKQTYSQNDSLACNYFLKRLKRNSVHILRYIFKFCFKVFGTFMPPCQNVVDSLNRCHTFFACQTCKYLIHLK